MKPVILSLCAVALFTPVGIGYAAAMAVEGIGRRLERASLLQRTMFVGVAVSESTAIYALVIALLLMMK